MLLLVVEVGLLLCGYQYWADIPNIRTSRKPQLPPAGSSLLLKAKAIVECYYVPCINVCNWDVDTAFDWIVVQLHCNGAMVRNFLTLVSWSSSAPSCQVRGNWCHWRFCNVRTHLELPGACYFNCCLSISHWKEPVISLPCWEPLKTDDLGCTKDWHSPLQSFEPLLCLSRWKQHSVLFWLFQTRQSGCQ